jgi:hypothetical protein
MEGCWEGLLNIYRRHIVDERHKPPANSKLCAGGALCGPPTLCTFLLVGVLIHLPVITSVLVVPYVDCQHCVPFCWRVLKIPASGEAHRSRALETTANAEDHCWRVGNVAR